MPHFEQLFVTAAGSPLMGLALERLAYCLRRRAQHETGVYFSSLSCRTLIYKGMLTPEQLSLVFPELWTSGWPAPWRSCTRASPPTPSRPGSWPTRSG